MRPRMSRSPAPLGSTDRVLIVRLGAVGDVVRTLPALRLIRASFPAAHLAWIVEDLSYDLIANHPDLDEVISLPRHELRTAIARPWRLPRLVTRLSRRLRERRFDVTLDFQGSLKSALVAWLSGASRRVGFAAGHSRELSFVLANEHVRPSGRRLNRIERNVVLAEAIGARAEVITLDLPETPDEGAAAAAILKDLVPDGMPAVILAPGTSRRQAYKRWPAERYGRLASSLRGDPGVATLVAWGPGEEDLAHSVLEASGGSVSLLPPTGLRVLAAVLRRVSLFVGADTGPMHLAWAVGCPVVALFGPTDPRLNAPIGAGHAVLRRGDSMDALSVDEVVAATRDLLLRPTARRVAGASSLSRSMLGRVPGGTAS